MIGHFRVCFDDSLCAAYHQRLGGTQMLTPTKLRLLRWIGWIRDEAANDECT